MSNPAPEIHLYTVSVLLFQIYIDCAVFVYFSPQAAFNYFIDTGRLFFLIVLQRSNLEHL